jgi:hypothetical protein
MPVVYHGTHERLGCLTPRPVRNYNSIGTWFTSTPWHAATFYGPNVYAFGLPPGQYLEAHTDSFSRFFLNWPLAEDTLTRKELAYLRTHAPETPAYDSYAKQIVRRLLLNREYIQTFRKMLERAGYQGVVWRDSRIDLRSGDPPHDVYVSFHQHALCPQRS